VVYIKFLCALCDLRGEKIFVFSVVIEFSAFSAISAVKKISVLSVFSVVEIISSFSAFLR